MKKLFFFLFAACLPFVASAASDDEILDKIEKANAALPAAQSHFDHSRFIKASGKTFNMEGAMYFVPPEKLRMQYTTPATDLTLVNDGSYFSGVSSLERLLKTRFRLDTPAKGAESR